MLLKDVAAKLETYKIMRHHVSCRFKHMNKRVQNEIGERVADKVGRNWALSRFMVRNWSAKMNEVETEM